MASGRPAAVTHASHSLGSVRLGTAAEIRRSLSPALHHGPRFSVICSSDRFLTTTTDRASSLCLADFGMIRQRCPSQQYDTIRNNTDVGTGECGWALAHPTSASTTVGLGNCRKLKSVFSVGVACALSRVVFSVMCVCQLHIMHSIFSLLLLYYC